MPNEIIKVPNLTAPELIATTKEQIDLTFVQSEILSWNFMGNEAGKRFEVMTHSLRRRPSIKTLFRRFRSKGFSGNTAAFLSWIGERKPVGYCISIPEDEHRRWSCPKDGTLCAMYFQQEEEHRILDLDRPDGNWSDETENDVAVAFREIIG